MLEGYSWDMTGYIPKYGFQCHEKGMTRLEAERTFQLEPEPPQMDDILWHMAHHGCAATGQRLLRP